ncbi:probable tRNA (uracil-O(2)-)-methyltransferase [Tribolium castaneum]|uniref:tRNA (uracil-O(2)-)-methyltransferase n=1 Tax=Tribolium castaneum TaxID=7070 RepID=D6WZR3_TRICA|nr:PREDICTED: probable tRNA (uracil-O(2)-)-methyltransferase [Tribolium castaneum]XP_015839056.1 PREDICTED: probable tRNA (uracil-O(2)-)-methyltransferase [Tribolium castaneum]XP_974292.2 PREDICTED: probable tRNA (uracil-O(2)-)-methyltransferase [Tribolium castaneum]EFA09658.1 putative tRNA (uracil-O(2)-)-methyltransferase-like Protein [Tribolium castaneum]|eukprot:XP_008198287.1 PREDICTED: probable tRNA (uracil-O(2)-)-methyltransferase [Tribolium castaneum]
MEEVPLVRSCTQVPLENFWKAVLVYHNRPHVINRKLAAIVPLIFCKITLNCPGVKRLRDVFTWESLIYEVRKLPDLSQITPQFIKNITEIYDKKATVEETALETLDNCYEGTFLSIRQLLSRKNNEKCLEIAIFDKDTQTVTFLAAQEQTSPIIAPRFPYHIHLTKSGHLTIILNEFEIAETASAEWLADKLFPKLMKWSENDISDDSVIKSLSLVAPSDYCTLYSELKVKYGRDLVEKWPQKAKTDPQKYVFEDIAIAAYLISLWRHLKTENINFVDCGCGNGLLVYILNKEGFKGCGFDIRSRQVWEIYGGEADLRTGAVTPESIYPDATWLIGNHSDELTPWIPIIALNSSPKTNFFVLPCCPYDLSGRKYVRINAALSQYGDYLDYVKNISTMCGFTTSVDKLRIPSTKRTCLVGNKNEPELEETRQKMKEFVEKNTRDFVPRAAVEKVRNCTRLDPDLKKKIINLIVDELLQTPCDSEISDWKTGGTMSLEELSQKISSEDRKALKNECGGLQTLIKNHRYIFELRKTWVTLRAPQTLKQTDKYKDKPCWFHENYPYGCLHSAEICCYKHVEKN